MKRFLLTTLSLCMIMIAFAQQKPITGKVVGTNEEPIIGASVVEKGTTNGTVTDLDG
ncbi:MAG: hypothetical protein HUJ90_02370, partial [Bacteroidales bacterium]|nr:hypothetical protein [Bacteroidales bacterium]